jgi:heptosyltransferase-2
MDTAGKAESISVKYWTLKTDPEKILVIRFHAIGDVAVTFPSCAGLREKFPAVKIGYLTSETAYGLVLSLSMIDDIHKFPLNFDATGTAGILKRIYRTFFRYLNAFKWGLYIRKDKYDIIVDLQRNRISRLIRRLAKPKSWSEFDRFSIKPAGMRVLDTFHRVGFGDLKLKYDIHVKKEILLRAEKILDEKNYDRSGKLVVMNPAGLWATRNWPLQNYIELANLIKQKHKVQFLILGTHRIKEKAVLICSSLPGSVIELVDKTSLEEAFAILQNASLVISEDSGLMHMSWVSGIPTIALLGSSNSVWTRPLGEHSRCLSSDDLPCGNCMSGQCRFGDVHCLTRYTPEYLSGIAEELLSYSGTRERYSSKNF